MDKFQNFAENWGWRFDLRLPQAVEKYKFATELDGETLPVLPIYGNVWDVVLTSATYTL